MGEIEQMSDEQVMAAIRNQEFMIEKWKARATILRAALLLRCREQGGSIETKSGKAHVRYIRKQQTAQLVFKPKYGGNK